MTRVLIFANFCFVDCDVFINRIDYTRLFIQITNKFKKFTQNIRADCKQGAIFNIGEQRARE